MIVLLCILNFAISWFNAWAVGREWAETKAAGGFPRFMSWMGAIMSASGFTWVYLVILGVIAGSLPEEYRLPAVYIERLFALGYLVIIFPILGSGLAITIDAWGHFWRKRTFGSGAVATWDTFAQVYNTYEAVRVLPDVFGKVGDLFDGDSDDEGYGKLVVIVVVLVVAAVLGGILTTTAIVRSTARSCAFARMAEAPAAPRSNRRW